MDPLNLKGSRPKNILEQNKFGPKNLWITNFISPRKSLDPIFSLIPNCFGRSQNLFKPKSFWEPKKEVKILIYFVLFPNILDLNFV